MARPGRCPWRLTCARSLNCGTAKNRCREQAQFHHEIVKSKLQNAIGIVLASILGIVFLIGFSVFWVITKAVFHSAIPRRLNNNQ